MWRESRSQGKLFQAEHVLHVVEAGLLFDEPLRGAKSAIGERLAARGFVRQFEALTVGGEDDGVVADDIAAANRVNADLRRSSFADKALAAVTGDFIKLLLAEDRKSTR